MKNKAFAAVGIAALIIATLATLAVACAAETDVIDQYTINLNVVGEGCSVVTNPTQDVYNYGDIVEFTAVPAIGWTFNGWSGDLTGTDNPATITMESNVTINAEFTQDIYTLIINVVGQGDVTPGNQTILSGTSVDLQATAADNWNFAGWSGDLNDTATNSTIIMDANKTLTATFTEIADTTTDDTTQTSTPTATTQPTATPTATQTVHPTTNPTTTPAPTQSPASTVTSTPVPSVAQSGVNEILALAAACIIIVVAIGVFVAKRKK
jgi:uncharacterized repeat protein (TIGR02543 family)